ncbi:hypothetical protein P3W45_000241 [Vairimorpha bombi]|jgi:hypothetical protein
MDYVLLFKIFGSNTLFLVKILTHIVDILIIIDLILLIYACFFTDKYTDSMVYLLLYHGSIPLIIAIQSYTGIDEFLTTIILFIALYFVYRYLCKYELFVISAVIINNITMVYIIIYYLLLNKLSISINIMFFALNSYIQFVMGLIYFEKAFILHEVLVAIIMSIYLITSYGLIDIYK